MKVPFNVLKKKVIQSFEYDYVDELLKINNGNVTESAKMAKLDRANLLRMMRKYKIKSEWYRDGSNN